MWATTSHNYPHTFTHWWQWHFASLHVGSNLGFVVLLKDTRVQTGEQTTNPEPPRPMSSASQCRTITANKYLSLIKAFCHKSTVSMLTLLLFCFKKKKKSDIMQFFIKKTHKTWILWACTYVYNFVFNCTHMSDVYVTFLLTVSTTSTQTYVNNADSKII